MSYEQGRKDSIEVLNEWIKQYKTWHQGAEDKHNKMAFYVAIQALKNAQDSILDLDPPESLTENKAGESMTKEVT